MIVETLQDNTFLEKTGNLRFRNDKEGRIILQVEEQSVDTHGDFILTWRDATISDIQWRDTNEQ